ncbi:MAG: c-type cytochrome [Betaproteobacteria bacterium]|nr:c-type cytochrome [Betaproteobacteria bacterium]
MQHQSWRTRMAVRAGIASTSRQYRRLIGAALAAALCAGSTALAQDGKALFEAKCAVCHNIGGGPKVGPDLKGIVAKRGKDGTVAVVLDPAKAGLKPTMPNLGVPRKDAETLVAYLDQMQGAAGMTAASKETASAPAAKEPAAQGTPAEIQLGGDLFEGKVRFSNGGPSCNACHHVRSDAHLGGGVLASELTLVFSRMGKQGVSAILGSSPFPVMQTAYAGKEFSDKEINALVGFLQQVDKEHARQMPKEWGWRMFSAGAGGVIVLLGIFSLAGRGRKKRCVNQDIYDRQVKSE